MKELLLTTILWIFLVENVRGCFRGWKRSKIPQNLAPAQYQQLVKLGSLDYLIYPQGPLSGAIGRPRSRSRIPDNIPLPLTGEKLTINKLPDGRLGFGDPIFKLPSAYKGPEGISSALSEASEYSPDEPPLANLRLPSGALVPLNRKAASQLVRAARKLQAAQRAGKLHADGSSREEGRIINDTIKNTRVALNNILGPFPYESLSHLSGTDQPTVTSPEDLNCDFSGDCCWHNMGKGTDDLEWLMLHQSPDADLASIAFRTSNLPTAPYAITGSQRTHSLAYGFLVSCPFLCTREEGILSFDHWTSEVVTIDACILPVSQRSFTSCQTIHSESGRTASVTIEKQDEPFVIVIVASEFIQPRGGVAAIDNIRYTGDVCSGEEQYSFIAEQAQSVTEPPNVNYDLPKTFNRDISFELKNIIDKLPAERFLDYGDFANSHLGANNFLDAIERRIPPEYFDLISSSSSSSSDSSNIIDSDDSEINAYDIPNTEPLPPSPRSTEDSEIFEDNFLEDNEASLIPRVQLDVGSDFDASESVTSYDDGDEFKINPNDVYGQGSDYDAVCQAVECDMQKGQICLWRNAGNVSFIPVGKQFANWASGVLKPRDESNFVAAALDRSNQLAILESPPFSPHIDFTISFKFFEAAYDVSFRVCYDSILSSEACQVFGRRAVTAADRAWREGRFTIPAGINRRLYLVAEGHSDNRGAVGLYDVTVVEARTPSGLIRVNC